MKRLRLIVMVVVVMVIGVVAIDCFRAREPRYQGRTLSEWINIEISASQKFRSSSYNIGKDPESDPACREAIQAVRHMAPDAIPILTDWALAEDSPRKAEVIYWLNKRKFLHIHLNTSSDRNFRASIGFWMIGTASETAWLALARETYSTNDQHRDLVLECLRQSNPDKEIFLPVLLHLTHDPNEIIQAHALRELHARYPKDAEAAGVYTNFPILKGYPTNHFPPL